MASAEPPGGVENVFEDRATVASWDRDYYHPIAERQYDRAVARMLRLLEVPEGGRVLDAGCGPGVHAIRAARLGHDVEAIDLSHTMLGEAERRAQDAGVSERITFQQQDLTRLGLEDASHEHAFSWGVVIHIPDAEAALSNLARVIAPGGRLALHLTNHAALDHSIEGGLRRVVRRPLELEHRRLGTGAWYEMHGERLWVWRFDLDAVAAFMAERGLTLRHRVVGEVTEIQRRVGGPARWGLLRLNAAASRLGVGVSRAATNLLVFERTA